SSPLRGGAVTTDCNSILRRHSTYIPAALLCGRRGLATRHASAADRAEAYCWLLTLAAEHRRAQTSVAAFIERLQQLGWIDGRNAHIDTRWATGDADRIRACATELAALAPDVILATGAVTQSFCWRVE